MLISLLINLFGEMCRLYVEISPYLLLGFFFAGLLHTLLGEKYIKKHFAVSGIWPTVKAALFGIPLPICSCGVIPLAESMRKDGASKSSTMTFLVSTPSSGVDSVLATYALMGPVYAIFRPIASFFAGIFVGLVTHLFSGKKENSMPIVQPVEADVAQQHGSFKKVFKGVLTYGFEVIPAEIAKWLLIGIAAGGAISALVPVDFASRYLDNGVLNYAAILLISIPLYVCATGSIPIAAALITKGVLPGAALAFLIAGPATNTVTISFVLKKMGKTITALYILSITAAAVVSGVIFVQVWTPSASDMEFITAGGEFIPDYLKIASAVVMAFILIHSKYNLGRFLKMSKEKAKENVTVHKVKVPDMTCQHCKMTIDGSLQSLPGVRSVKIDLASKEVAVEVDEHLDRNAILERIQGEGYHPE